MPPIPVLHIKDSSGMFGSERVILTIARNLDRTRFDFHLLCMRRPDRRSEALIGQAQRLGVRVIPVPTRRRVQVDALLALRRLLKEERYAILHTHDYKSDIYGFLGSIGLPVRRVLTSHGSTRDSLRKRAYLMLDERGIYPFYDRIVAVSQELGSRLQRGRFGGRVATVQNGFDFELFRELAPEEPEVRRRLAAMKSPGGFLFAVVGRLFPDKGHVYFLEAFQRLKPLFPRIKAVFVGEGPYRSRLEEWIRSQGLGEDVTFCGFVGDMPAIYSAIDCLVMPSLTEGLPYTLLEAMASGVPVVASAVGDIPCLVEHGETGLLAPPADASALEICMAAVLNDRDKAREMAKKGAEIVRDRFSARRMAAQIGNIYSELTND